jgi:hypothetical protein
MLIVPGFPGSRNECSQFAELVFINPASKTLCGRERLHRRVLQPAVIPVARVYGPATLPVIPFADLCNESVALGEFWGGNGNQRDQADADNTLQRVIPLNVTGSGSMS